MFAASEWFIVFIDKGFQFLDNKLEVSVASEFVQFCFFAVGLRHVLPCLSGEILGKTVIYIIDTNDDARPNCTCFYQAIHDLVYPPLLSVPRRSGIEQHIAVVHVDHVARVACLLTFG